MSMCTEVVVGTYNKPELRLVLEGLARQTDPEFDVVIADDGSGPEMASLVQEYQSRLPRLRHVWQEDRGFRKNRILNEAVRTSRADYFIFTDADCIPVPQFVADHKAFARPGDAVTGPRVYLGPRLSAGIMSGAIPIDRLFHAPSPAWFALSGRMRQSRRALRWPSKLLNTKRRRRKSLRGANMAVWRADLEKVNGFDNGFVEYSAGEDTDLNWRLQAIGCHTVRMAGRGCVFHLYHPASVPSAASYNRMIANREAGKVWADDGLLPSPELQSATHYETD